MADDASVPVTVTLVAGTGAVRVRVIVHEPLAGTVRPETVAVPLVAGKAERTTLPAHAVLPAVTLNAVAAASVIAKCVVVSAAAFGLVTVNVCVAVAVVSSVVVAEPVVVGDVPNTCSVCEAAVALFP